MAVKRKYPVGIQSFEKLRNEGYLYVDKTPLIYKMITEGCPYFLSRPRRFGKSLLCSTLEAVFLGRRELFESFTTEDGIEQPQLFIATTDWKWDTYPVIRFDFSKTREYTLAVLDRQIDSDKELEAGVRQRFSSVFSVLKPLDDHLQFVFITGISKFSQMGIFSSLNQLKNVSMLMDYETGLLTESRLCADGGRYDETSSVMGPEGHLGKTILLSILQVLTGPVRYLL